MCIRDSARNPIQCGLCQLHRLDGVGKAGRLCGPGNRRDIRPRLRQRRVKGRSEIRIRYLRKGRQAKFGVPLGQQSIHHKVSFAAKL